MSKLQKGISFLSVLLSVTVIGIIAGVGWYVWDKNQNQKPVITNFDECVAAGNPIMESYPEQCAANGQTFVNEKLQVPPASTDEVVGYLEIKEWDVRIPLTEPIKNATYKMVSIGEDYPGPYAFLSTQELDSSVKCKDYYKPFPDHNYPTFQYIERLLPGDKASEVGDPNLTPLEALEKYPEYYNQLGSTVFGFKHGNGEPCEEQAASILPAFQKAFEGIAVLN